MLFTIPVSGFNVVADQCISVLCVSQLIVEYYHSGTTPLCFLSILLWLSSNSCRFVCLEIYYYEPHKNLTYVS